MGRIVISGPRKAQNELLAMHLRKCLSIASAKVIISKNIQDDPACGEIILHDCSCIDQSGVEAESQRILSRLGGQNCALAVFNIAQSDDVEQNLIFMGVRGVFFESDGIETLVRGVGALLNGEVWASRKTLSICLGKTQQQPRQAFVQDENGLSSREREILLLTASGNSDNQIAENLCISANTVKTHLYRAFKKIEVKNRLQAALWVAKNI